MSKRTFITLWKNDFETENTPLSVQHFYEHEIIDLFGINSSQFDAKIIELFNQKKYEDVTPNHQVLEWYDRQANYYFGSTGEERNQLKLEYEKKYPIPCLLKFDISCFYKA